MAKTAEQLIHEFEKYKGRKATQAERAYAKQYVAKLVPPQETRYAKPSESVLAKPFAPKETTTRGNTPIPSIMRPGRRVYEGGAGQIALDALTSVPRLASAFVGAIIKPENGSFRNRLMNPSHNFGELVNEMNPVKAGPMRIGNAAAGLALDIGSDPLTYLAGPISKGIEAMAGSEKLIPRVIGKILSPVSSTIDAIKGNSVKAAMQGVAGPIRGRIAGAVKARADLRLLEPLTDQYLINSGLNQLDTMAREQSIRDWANAEAKRITGKKATGILGTSVHANPESAAAAQGAKDFLGLNIDKVYDSKRNMSDALHAELDKAFMRTRAAAKRASRSASRLEGQARAFNASAKTIGAPLNDVNTGAEATAKKLAEQHAAKEAAWESMMGLTDRSYGRASEAAKQTATAYKSAANQHKQAVDAYVSKMDEIANLERDIANMRGGTRGSMLEKAPDAESLSVPIAPIPTEPPNPAEYLDPKIHEAMMSETGVPFGIDAATKQNPVDKAFMARRALARAKADAQIMKARVDQAERAMNAASSRLSNAPPDVRQAISEYNKATKGVVQLSERSRGLARTQRAFDVTTARADRRLAKAEELRQKARDMASLLKPLQIRTEAAAKEYAHNGGQIEDTAWHLLNQKTEAAASEARAGLLKAGEFMGLDRGALEAQLRDTLEREDMLGVAGAMEKVLKPEQAAFNQGTHLRRIYTESMSPDEFVHTLENDPEKLMGYVSEQASKNLKGVNGSGAGVAKGRENMDLATREGLGYVPDAAERVRIGETIAGRAIARKAMFRNIAENFAVSKSAAASGNIAASRLKMGTESPFMFRQLPEGDTWGELSGRWVPAEIHKQLIEKFAPRPFSENPNVTLRNMGKAYRSLISSWKFGKVILSPAARARNIVSNGWRAYTELGMNPAQFSEYSVKAFKEYNDNSPVFREFLESSPTGHQTFASTELSNPVALAGIHKHVGNIKEVGNELAKRAASGYERDENVSKLAIYMWAKEHGATPQEAGKMAERALFTYSKAHPVVKGAVKSGVIPFATYPSLAIPAEAKAFAKHPERLANIAKAIREVEGIDPGDVSQGNYEKRTLPDYRGDSLLARVPYLKDKAGRSQFLDLTYYAPTGQLMGDSPANQAMQMVNPLARMAFELALNKQMGVPFPIANEGDTEGQQLRDKAAYVANGLLPSLAPGGYGVQAIKQAATGIKDSQGADKPLIPAILANTVGAKLVPVDAKANADKMRKGLLGDQMDMSSAIKALEREFVAGMYGDPKSPQAKAEFQKRVKEIQAKFIQKVKKVKDLTRSQGGINVP